jgi:hypothetical protein
MSKEVADRFIEALHKLEEERDVEDLVEIHTEDCEVGTVSVPQTFKGHDGLREFWANYCKNHRHQRKPERPGGPVRPRPELREPAGLEIAGRADPPEREAATRSPFHERRDRCDHCARRYSP